MIYVHTKLKRRKTTAEILERTFATNTVSKKAKNVFDEVDSAAYSTLIKGRTTAMKKLPENMAPACYTYSTEFRNEIEQDELGAGEYIKRKGDIVFSDLPYYLGGIRTKTVRSMIRSRPKKRGTLRGCYDISRSQEPMSCTLVFPPVWILVQGSAVWIHRWAYRPCFKSRGL